MIFLPEGRTRSGFIVVGGAAQDVAPRNTERTAMTFQNTSQVAMRLREDGKSASDTRGYILNPGDATQVSTCNRISVFCATTGATYESTEI